MDIEEKIRKASKSILSIAAEEGLSPLDFYTCLLALIVTGAKSFKMSKEDLKDVLQIVIDQHASE